MKSNHQLYSVNKEDQEKLMATNHLYSSGSIILSEGSTKLRWVMLGLVMACFGLN